MNGGIFLLDKREGITSARAIEEIKRKFNLKKIGHAGTLDPMATGLLVCLVDGATKAASLFEKGIKTYAGTFRFGLRTSTDDITGEVIESSNNLPSFEAILEASREFVGEISQTPPAVSAVKVNGERAYKLARKGIVPELKSRTIRIDSFELSPCTQEELKFRIVCTSGTYVRSIARDLGAKLECGGTLSSLRREGSSPFIVSQAKKIEDLSMSDLIGDVFEKFEGERVCRP